MDSLEKPPLTGQMKVAEVLESYPGAEEVFKRLSYRCSECVVMFEDTLETAAKLHDKDLIQLLKALEMAGETKLSPP